MRGLLAGLAALGPARLAAIGAVGAVTLGLLLFFALRLPGGAPMALLYNDLDLRDAGAVADQLDKLHIPHELGADGAAIKVPRDQVAQARLALAQAGLPSGGSIGYEIFDRGDGLTATQFKQDINETRALEGELARSIRLMHGVRGVRVHLVLPRHEPFAQEQQAAQASVLLTMAGAMRMDRDGVQAVLNLVAAAVPGLKPQNIAIVDDRGELLARAGQPSDGEGSAATQDELRHATETRLSHEVEEMLEPTLGVGHVRAEASVEMDFDQTRETDEKFDPDGQVARSTQAVTDASKTTEKDNAVTVQNNLPNPEPTGSGGGSVEQRKEETTNYEIGKTTRTVLHDQPRIRRITLAVMVDGVTLRGKDGKPVWSERPADELARIATLARGVIGYDASRGDKVDIVSMKFAPPEADTSAPSGSLLRPDSADLVEMLKIGLFGVVAVIAMLTVLRPMALKLAAVPPAQLAGPDAPAALTAEATPPLLGAPAPAGLLTDESMVAISNVEGQIKASMIRRIAELVDRHPDDTLAILRSWMAQVAR